MGVWLARRVIPPHVAVLFAVLVLVFFFQPLFLDTINVPVDYYENLPPWADQRGRPPRMSNSLLNDVALQIVPWAHEVRTQWKALRVPLWNPTAASGYPLLANGQSSALSLFRLAALPLDLAHSMTAEGAWKVLIALTFTFLYCRRRYSVPGSILAAISFGFGAFMMVWLHYPHASVAAFLPAVLFQIDLLAEKLSYRRFVFSAALWAIVLMAGHPETASHIGFTAVLAILWIALIEKSAARPARFVLAAIGSIVAGCLLAAPFIFPFLDAATKSVRFAAVKVSPPPLGLLADWASTIGMLEPHFFGAVPLQRAWGPAGPEIITGFVGILGVVACISVFLHVVLKRRWRSREAFFLLMTVIAIGVIYSWPGVVHAFNLVFRFAANARLRLLFAFFLSVQVAPMVDLILRGERRLVLLGTLAASVLYASMLFFPFPTRTERADAVLALLPGVAVLMILTAVVLAVRWQQALLVILSVAMIGEIWNVTFYWNPVLPRSAMYPLTPQIRRLLELRDQNAPNTFRIAGHGPSLFPNLATIYGLEDIRAHDPMASARYVAFLQFVGGYTAWEYFAFWVDTESRLLNYLNVKYYVASRTLNLDESRYRLLYDARDGRIWENREFLPRFFPVENVLLDYDKQRFAERLRRQVNWADTVIVDRLEVENDRMRTDLLTPHPAQPVARVTITQSLPTSYRMRVFAPRYTMISSSIPWYPGWRVTRDGKPLRLMRVNSAFCGFVVPAGTYDVEVRYAPAAFSAGIVASALTIVALIVASRRI